MTTRETKVWTGTEWAQIAVPSGRIGKSAYELAVDNGFNGTFEEWFASMRGPTGPAGPAGPSGIQGPIGIGVPPGGTRGQVLVKNSVNDYDFSWQTIDEISGSYTLENANPVVPIDAATGGVTSTYYSSTTGHTYKVHKFFYTNTTEEFITNVNIIGKLLVVSGGGGGGNASLSYSGGGGGGGAVWFADYAFGIGTHSAFVGIGGVGTVSGSGVNGQNSTFDNIICYGGGGGGGPSGGNQSPKSGRNGGSGGGGGAGNWGGGLGLGGTGSSLSKFWFSNGSNGGGGTGGAGGSSNLTINITGTTVTYGPGGPGGVQQQAVSYNTPSNVGSGGGGNGNLGAAASSGGTGIIIIRYRIA